MRLFATAATWISASATPPREIVNSGEPQGVDWPEVSAIFSIDADGDVNGSYGYVYDAWGPIPARRTASSTPAPAVPHDGSRETAPHQSLSLIHI